MTTAKIGERYQVAIPKKEREKLGLRPHMKVNIEAKGEHLVLYPVRTGGLRGLGADLADGTDATDYVKELRAEWGRHS